MSAFEMVDQDDIVGKLTCFDRLIFKGHLLSLYHLGGMAAFDAVGGQKYLVRIAKEQPAVFCMLLGKVLLHELAAGAGALRHELVLRWVTPEIAAARGWLENELKSGDGEGNVAPGEEEEIIH